jgi:hypothetical protein
LHDTAVPPLPWRCIKTFPWKRTTGKIDEGVREGFKIVTSSLFKAQVGVERGIACRTNQIFVRPTRDMNEGDFVAISVCKPEIDDIDQVALAMNAYEKVIGFDVTVDVVSRMDVFNTGNLGVKSD